MKTVKVVAAVLCDSLREKQSIFATARGYGEFKGQWEFPGGKVEPGESTEQALRREIREELDVNIVLGDLIETVEYDYPAFHLSMDCFWCELSGDALKLLEAEEGRWLTKAELYTVTLAPRGYLPHSEYRVKDGRAGSLADAGTSTVAAPL